MSLTIASLTNHQVRLAQRPVGTPTRDNWAFTSEPVGEPAAGGVLVKTLALSLDPAMRGWMNDAKSYIPPVGIGEVMRAGGIGKVDRLEEPEIRRRRPRVGGPRRAGIHAGPEDQIKRSGMFKIDPRLGTITQWLNVLGMPGMTGYFGLLDVGQPAPATPWWSPAQRARWARPWASSPRSRAAAWSASPAAGPSATGW